MCIIVPLCAFVHFFCAVSVWQTTFHEVQFSIAFVYDVLISLCVRKHSFPIGEAQHWKSVGFI